ncbi:SRPBCC family protein [Streptomyces sp. NPDC058319]|uniref:SRPBCC family protein n=2 Tax=Streptomyces TaxID=1883 RepID=UPI0036E2CC1B
MHDGEGLHVRCEVRVRADPARVWQLVTDIHLPARLSPELQRVEWLDGADRPALGARFEGHNSNPLAGDWRTVSHVVELDERRVFAWAVTDPDGRYGAPAPDLAQALAFWRYELEADDGGTLLRQSMRGGPGRSGVTVAIEQRPDRKEAILAYRRDELRRGMEATLQGIKKLAEEAGG